MPNWSLGGSEFEVEYHIGLGLEASSSVALLAHACMNCWCQMWQLMGKELIQAKPICLSTSSSERLTVKKWHGSQVSSCSYYFFSTFDFCSLHLGWAYETVFQLLLWGWHWDEATCIQRYSKTGSIWCTDTVVILSYIAYTWKIDNRQGTYLTQ